MRFALIGCGRISYNHIVAAKNNKLDIVALCDLKQENMEDKILKLELQEDIKCYCDYREMLKKEIIDLIAIATESGKHAQIGLDCI